MPQYHYNGRDKLGALRTGVRFAQTAEALGEELSRNGIYITEIKLDKTKESKLINFSSLFESRTAQMEELVIFARQMRLLSQSGIPIISALRHLASYTTSVRLTEALNGISEQIEKGTSMSDAMTGYPKVFSPLIVNIVKIGENTGLLTEAFGNLHDYLAFEIKNTKMIKSTFRYPMFVIFTIFIAVGIMNVYVIPTFAHFYGNLSTALPWETLALIGMSNIFTHYGFYILFALIGIVYLVRRYIKTPLGKIKYHHLLLHLPLFGEIYTRLLLIRLSQTFAIVLNAGIHVSQGLSLVKKSLNNSYIENQISITQELIERGTSFSLSMSGIELFTPLENQIIAIGEMNGELGPSMSYISHFQSSEIEYDIKRLNDRLGPLLIGVISVFVLILALGIYLPIWNMIDTVH